MKPDYAAGHKWRRLAAAISYALEIHAGRVKTIWNYRALAYVFHRRLTQRLGA